MYFLQGFTMGLAYVAPIGLQNLFVINSAMAQKRSRVYLTALIVIFFDVTLAMACFFGVGAVMETNDLLKKAILLVGSLIVIWIGITLLRDEGTAPEGVDVNIPIAKVITTACVVTWFNPQALIDGSMMLGAFRASLPSDQSTMFIIGVMCASFSWFMGLSTVVSFAKKIISPKILRWINIICGIVIIFYGLKLLWTFVQMVM